MKKSLTVIITAAATALTILGGKRWLKTTDEFHNDINCVRQCLKRRTTKIQKAHVAEENNNE